MDTSFLMHRNPIGACFRECGDEFVGSFDHQVTIDRDPGDLAKRGDYGRADRKVRNEMAVHDVDVENSGSALDGGLRIVAEPCEVSRENGGSKFDHGNIDSAASGSAGHLGFLRLHECHLFDQAAGDPIASEAAHGARIVFAFDDGQPGDAAIEHGGGCND